MDNNKINNLYIITLIIIVNFIIYHFNIPLFLNNCYESIEDTDSIDKIFNNSTLKKIKININNSLNKTIKYAFKYKILKLFNNKLFVSNIEDKEDIADIKIDNEIKENLSNFNKIYKQKFIYNNFYNTFYIIMITTIVNFIIFYLNKSSTVIYNDNIINNDIDKIFNTSNENIKSVNFEKGISNNLLSGKINSKLIKSEIGIFNNAYIKNQKSDNLLSDQINSKSIKSHIGDFKELHTKNSISDKIFNNLLKTKKIKSEEGIFNDVHTHSITTDKIFNNIIETNQLNGNNANISNLDSILINSKKIISESIRGEKINTDILEAKDIAVVSDLRFKKNILYNNISSDLLDNINLATFEYLNQNTNHIGFIAQEIEKYYPQLINKNKNGYLSVKYLEMIPLLLDYNKKLKKRILSLENKINIDY